MIYVRLLYLGAIATAAGIGAVVAFIIERWLK